MPSKLENVVKSKVIFVHIEYVCPASVKTVLRLEPVKAQWVEKA